MPPPSDVSGLIKTLEKIDAYLRNRSTKFLLSDRLTRADCYIIPVLQHLRVAGKVSCYSKFNLFLYESMLARWPMTLIVNLICFFTREWTCYQHVFNDRLKYVVVFANFYCASIRERFIRDVYGRSSREGQESSRESYKATYSSMMH